ncbi:helix-turn-helix protein [Ruminiclostridium sufflavum DSM 19573]|uniref:Stage 0 sporulation protein A homolog n=1 Tax=Ruminiclostridium sufflavum DSM 19573 TaxID=1121337 RepID=A0A318XQX9_9FIRM|nr:response regulator [Ruminiclostridium sufflavum]PYG88719.1 helix-turn-helix protein [Ruminiclostridium sufflavum DSM 19573]
MYSAIIIDDEPWTIIDIEQTWPMEELGFRITDSFKDPKTALLHIVTQKPDLIITDIRMPNMTGIELMQKIREQNIASEIIIISGYGEFEYAKKAIQFGATGYCLKPLNPKETYETLKLAKEHLDKYNQENNGLTDNSTAVEVNIDNFDQMINYINTHFSKTLTLKSLADKFYLNPNYCCSLFTKYKNTTFSQYLTGIRVTEAKKLLESSSYSLDKISSLVGFHDYFYFSKVFKKYSKLSPKDYRKNFKENQT